MRLPGPARRRWHTVVFINHRLVKSTPIYTQPCCFSSVQIYQYISSCDYTWFYKKCGFLTPRSPLLINLPWANILSWIELTSFVTTIVGIAVTNAAKSCITAPKRLRWNHNDLILASGGIQFQSWKYRYLRYRMPPFTTNDRTTLSFTCWMVLM